MMRFQNSRPLPDVTHTGQVKELLRTSRRWSLICLSLSMLWLLSAPAAAKKKQRFNDPQQPWAVLMTNKGAIIIQLYEKHAPKTVANFIGLATGNKSWKHPKTKKTLSKPFYDGLEFFRIIPTYLLKVGCPLNRGTKGSGSTTPDEFHEELRHDSAGIVSMANAGPDTNSSQFFITLRSTPWLDVRELVGKFCSNFTLPFRCANNTHCKRYKKQFPKASHGPAVCKKRRMRRGYTIFGKVIHGMKVVEAISEVSVNVSGRPISPVRILRVHILRARKWKRSWLKLPTTQDD